MKKIISGILLVFTLNAYSQMDYPALKYGTDILAADSQQLSLNIYNLNYLHNTEWFGNIPHSGTLFGYQLIPELQYQVSPHFILRGGIYLQKEFGRPEYTTVQPTFTAKYQIPHASFLIGTIEGGINHGFIEPIYDYKWLINERIENGLQIKVDAKHYKQDLYINWRRNIHLGDPFKEEFDIGYSAAFNLFENNKWSFSIPVQLMYSHKGGQIDATNEPLTSIVNDAAGIKITYKHDGRLLKNVQFDNYYVNYRDISKFKRQPFLTGNAYLAHLLFDYKEVGIDLRYWNGKNYIAPRGMILFSSVSEKHPGYTEPNRELLIASFIFNKEIAKNLFFNGRIVPYYDLRERNIASHKKTGLEYSYEVYLKYVLRVNLAKVKNVLPSPPSS